MPPLTDTAESLELILALSRLSRRHKRQIDLLTGANRLIADHFQAARCASLILSDGDQSLSVLCEHGSPDLPELTGRQYAARTASQWRQQMSSGSAVSLTALSPQGTGAAATIQFIEDSETPTVLSAPLSKDGQFYGCLCIGWHKPLDLDEGILKLAQSIAKELSEQLADLSSPQPESQPIANDADAFAQGSQSESHPEKQIVWERLKCQLITRLHASLDRDIILQAAADFIARSLRVKTCLIIRIDGQLPAIITHEYSQPDVSPLGLGRTGLLPPGAINFLRSRTVAVNDLNHPNRFNGLSSEDQGSLLERGTNAILSCPMSQLGTLYGIIVAESDAPRRWDPAEIELIEAAAAHGAVALSHSRAYSQLKEQIFNMNLMSNLTQQLTSVLDQASRGLRPDRTIENAKPTDSALAPLSQRELEVLRLIASGLANREIAQRLFLTESTVELHASRIRKKLKLKSRTALVKFACDNHLV